MSTTGSHPNHCCSRLSWELHWAAVNVSSFGLCSQSDPKVLSLVLHVQGLHEAPCLPPHIWNPLPEIARGLSCQGELSRVSTAPTEPVSAAEQPLSGQAPVCPAGNSLSNPNSLPPSNGLSPLPWEGKGFLCAGCCGPYISLSNLHHIVTSRAHVAVRALGEKK